MFDEEAKDSRSASLHAACGSSSATGSGFGESYSLSNPSIHAGEDIPQPTIFNGKLKGYQLKGMNWLANLYEQVPTSNCDVRDPSGFASSIINTTPLQLALCLKCVYLYTSKYSFSPLFSSLSAGNQRNPGRRDGTGEDGPEYRPVGTPCRGERAPAQRVSFSAHFQKALWNIQLTLLLLLTNENI